jgi:signal transduction histidine kinase/CheY-like chemotaxis protein
LPQPDLARFLEEQRDVIVARFVGEVTRTGLAPADAAPPLLVDHIPRFLDEIVAELTPAGGMRLSLDAVDTSKTARQHGGQRWVLGYDLQAVVREYGVLRHCILQMAKASGLLLTMDEFDVLARCLSVGVAEAVTEYVKHSDAQMASRRATLEFLAEAGQLLSSSLDYRFTLTRLTGLIVPRLADWCSVHIQGVGVDATPIAHVDPARAEVLRDMYRRFPLPDDAPYGAPYVLRTGEAQLIAEMTPDILAAVAQSPEHAAIIRGTGFRSGIVVPLGVQGNAFGVLMLAYGESGRSYDADDLVFAGDLARRASIAIDNARLYEVSQNERSRAEAATRAKDEFVAVVSHELRTPLNAILGWVRLLRSGTLPESKREHALDVIERNGRAQSQLVTDLLDISRIITGKIRLNLSQVDLANVAAMAIEGVRPAAEAKSIQLELHAEPTAAVLRADGDRLQQVVWNLLSNAVKFTPKGGRVEVRLRQVDSDFELRIEDNGVGIAPEFLPYLFETFRQSSASATRSHGGLGLGLSIARHIVELHGGSIEARSPGTGRGATFVVRFPVTSVISTTTGVARVAATEALAVDALVHVDLGGIRVLVVDDEPDARELVAYVLEDSGADVRLAGSASEALAVLETFVPHVIVSDIGMPEEDGHALIRAIRLLPGAERKNIPAIALTAFVRDQDRTRALVSGFNLHIGKPVEPAALVLAVADLAGNGPR